MVEQVNIIVIYRPFN